MAVARQAEFQKAGSTGSAEPDFFQTFRQICPVFWQFFQIYERTN